MRSLVSSLVTALLAALCCVGLVTGCTQQPSGDHSHGTASHAHGRDAHTHDSGSRLTVTAWGDRVEIFAERPVLVAGERSAPWAIHVTDRSDYRPVAEGTLTLRFRRPDGAAYVHTANAPDRPGIFAPQPEIPETGTFQLFAIVEGPAIRDTVALGGVTVHEVASAAEASPDAPEISLAKEQQWKMNFGTAVAQEQSVQASVEVPGAVRPAPGHYARVAAPVSGLAPAGRNADVPAEGEAVRAGQALGVLAPSGGTGSYADVKARVERLQREVDRAERLYAAEAIPEKQLVETRHDLEVARAALESMGGGEDSGFNYTLRAPIDGRVHERHLVPGSRVDVGTVLYTVVDPSEVRVRLRVPARHADRLDATAGGTFVVEGSDRRYRTDRVASVGAAVDAETRTIPVALAADNPNGHLKVGMRAEAHLFLGEATTGVAIPNAAIQTEDGRPVAYVQTGGEGFERRPLQLGLTDGTVTLVERGVEASEHVVTDGAYQVYLASLNTAQVGGHGHPH